MDSVRTHGHRAARIDPLDLIQREEVAALNPTRYGLTDDEQKYNVNGIIWTKPVEQLREDTEEWWTLGQITRHLRALYVDRIAYEVCFTLSIDLPAIWTWRYTDFTHCSSCTLRPKPNVSGSRIFWNPGHLRRRVQRRWRIARSGESMVF